MKPYNLRAQLVLSHHERTRPEKGVLAVIRSEHSSFKFPIWRLRTAFFFFTSASSQQKGCILPESLMPLRLVLLYNVSHLQPQELHVTSIPNLFLSASHSFPSPRRRKIRMSSLCPRGWRWYLCRRREQSEAQRPPTVRQR